MNKAVSLQQRARPLTDAEIAGIPWLARLTAKEQDKARARLTAATAQPGELLCRIGRAPTYWFGVIDGLLKMSNDDSHGPPMTFTGVPPGAWFGEGTLLKREPYRYNIQALRRSTVAGLPLETIAAGGKLAIVNRGPTALDARATLKVDGGAGEVLAAVAERLVEA